MKNTLFHTLLFMILLFTVSCKKDPKSDKLDVPVATQDSTDVAIEEVVEEKPKPVVKKKKKSTKKKVTPKPKKTIHIPGTTFSTNNTAAKKYIRDYERYVLNYKKAVEAKDMDSFLKLSSASSDLTKQYYTLMEKLPGEEIEKLSRYMQAKSKQINELSAKM